MSLESVIEMQLPHKNLHYRLEVDLLDVNFKQKHILRLQALKSRLSQTNRIRYLEYIGDLVAEGNVNFITTRKTSRISGYGGILYGQLIWQWHAGI